MSFSPTVDIVVPCYNVDHIVAKCIDSLLQQSYDKNTITIYLINDGSTDTTGEILDSFVHHKQVHIIHLESNSGLSTARNAGIKAGNGEVIFLLDSDMVVKQNWIIAHLNTLKETGIIGVVGDSLLPEGQTPNILDSYLYNPRRGGRRFGGGVPIGFSYLLFNNTSLKRSVFDVVKLFDENITSYGGEDTELAIRIWETYPDGLRFSVSAGCEHHHPRELTDYCNSMYSYGKLNLPLLLKQFPQYKKELAGEWIKSIKGYLLFNTLILCGISKLSHFCNCFWITRYLVVNSVIRGARKTYKSRN